VIVIVPLLQPGPLQPEKIEAVDAIVVKVICVPLLAVWVQSLPQLMPVPVTVPLPFPAFAIVKVNEIRLKVAVHEMLLVTITVPLLQPEPVQPAKVELLAATAVSTT
jgi:hypothetical protein